MTSVNNQVHMLDPSVVPQLQNALRHAYSEFPYYQQAFARAGVGPDDDPRVILDRLPPLDTRGYLCLQQDIATRLGSSHFLTEATSGTTGHRKTRFTTLVDERAEASLCQRFFTSCGIRNTDRILALDIDSSDIYMFYGQVLHSAGIAHFSYANVRPHHSEPVFEKLCRDATVIITVPSILWRYRDAFRQARLSGELHALDKVIYIGEPMHASLRTMLNSELGIETFSFYGTTETGSIAGECRCHDGLHVYTDAVVPTLLNPHRSQEGLSGVVAWTTLHFRDQPLIKYVTHDRFTFVEDECACGMIFPRATGIHRTDDHFSLYGHQFSHNAFQMRLEERWGSLDFLTIHLDQADGRDRISFWVPERLSSHDRAVREVITNTDDLSYFLRLGCVDVGINYGLPQGQIRRKILRVLDTRYNNSTNGPQNTGRRTTLRYR